MKPVTLFFLILMLPMGCSRVTKPAQEIPAIVRAQLVKSVQQETPQQIRMIGTVHAKETAAISAQIPGNIRQVLVRAGDRVRAGQLLVTLDAAAMQSALNRAIAAQSAAEKQQAVAQANAALALSTLARYQMLKDEKTVSPQEFDEVERRSQVGAFQLQALEAQHAEAVAAVAGARAQLSYTALHAPFAGVVTARMADPGTLATPGVPLLQIDRDGPLQLYTMVDESFINSVRLGMKIPVNADGANSGVIVTTVAQIVPAADPQSRTFLVKLDLPHTGELRAGMYAEAGFPGATREVVLVPQSAVVTRGSLTWVYALDQNSLARLRYVTLGNTHGDGVEVLSGLTDGEMLVSHPGDRDIAGKRIEAP